jgi:hypothetical protein
MLFSRYRASEQFFISWCGSAKRDKSVPPRPQETVEMSGGSLITESGNALPRSLTHTRSRGGWTRTRRVE